MAEPTGDDFVLKLPSAAQAASLARRFVADHSDSLPAELVEDAEILVSELVTNAVQHGRPDITLRVCLDPPLIGVAVDDAGGELPPSHPTAPDPAQPHGRGLLIVDRLATSWGVAARDDGAGKTVWFRIGAPTPSGS